MLGYGSISEGAISEIEFLAERDRPGKGRTTDTLKYPDSVIDRLLYSGDMLDFLLYPADEEEE